jgi:hypothetical protein
MLFERRAESYLDMECLAMAASALSDRLGKELKGSKGQGL